MAGQSIIMRIRKRKRRSWEGARVEGKQKKILSGPGAFRPHFKQIGNNIAQGGRVKVPSLAIAPALFLHFRVLHSQGV